MLLALFVFIVAEKNVHGHQQAVTDTTQQGQACLQQGSSCIICDFQLTAGAELPVQPELHIESKQISHFTAAFSSLYLQSSPSCLSERGPPFFC